MPACVQTAEVLLTNITQPPVYDPKKGKHFEGCEPPGQGQKQSYLLAILKYDSREPIMRDSDGIG